MGSGRAYWLAAVVIALVLWLPAQAGAKAGEERILYYSGSGIHAVYPDGTGEQRLFGGRVELPAISPDGRRVAYQRERRGNTDIYVANSDGSGERRLTKTAGPDTSPTWSPDGRRLAFGSSRGGKYGIYTISVGGGDVRRITRGRYDSSPDWSPDGRRLAFERAGVIHTVGSGGGRPQRLTYGNSPDWSSDGERIAFSDGYDSQIFTIGADGSGRQRLTGGRLLTSINPVWSPDGERIAYSRGRYGERLFRVYVMNADGSGKRLVAKDARLSLFAADWGAIGKAARTQSPEIHTSSLSSMSSPSGWRLTLRARIVDNGLTVKKANIRLMVDGKRRGYSYNGKSGRLTAVLNPSPGRHEIRLVATDRTGNTAARNWTVRAGR